MFVEPAAKIMANEEPEEDTNEESSDLDSTGAIDLDGGLAGFMEDNSIFSGVKTELAEAIKPLEDGMDDACDTNQSESL